MPGQNQTMHSVSQCGKNMFCGYLITLFTLQPCSDELVEKKVKVEPTPNGAPDPPSSVPPPPEPAPAYPTYPSWGSYPVRNCDVTCSRG